MSSSLWLTGRQRARIWIGATLKTIGQSFALYPLPLKSAAPLRTFAFPPFEPSAANSSGSDAQASNAANTSASSTGQPDESSNHDGTARRLNGISFLNYDAWTNDREQARRYLEENRELIGQLNAYVDSPLLISTNTGVVEIPALPDWPTQGSPIDWNVTLGSQLAVLDLTMQDQTEKGQLEQAWSTLESMASLIRLLTHQQSTFAYEILTQRIIRWAEHADQTLPRLTTASSFLSRLRHQNKSLADLQFYLQENCVF